MTIGDEIEEWAGTRPVWQQRILQSLAEGLPITEVELSAAVDELLDPSSSADSSKPLDLALASPEDVTVTLTALRGCKGVNALTDDQELDFGASGLTVVYGDNGSGKSGYARLIKDAVGARHPAQIFPDVFKERPGEPSAVVHYAADDDPREHKTPGPPEPLVRRMHFYDEHCGDAYLARKSVITYRPSALVLLDGLIEVCDRLRGALGQRLRDNFARSLDLDLPADTNAATFVAAISADTTTAAIKTATTLDLEAIQKRARATGEVARLEASNVTFERTRLDGLAKNASALSVLLTAAVAELGMEALSQAEADLRRAEDLRTVAVVAASNDFENELPGVGGATWRAMWQAARAYSTVDAYHDEPFPVTHDSARCPLCQQGLNAGARSRLERFDQYMRDTTERDASVAEDVVHARQVRLDTLSVGDDSGGARLSASLTDAPDLEARVQISLQAAKMARDAVSSWLAGTGDRPAAFSAAGEVADLDERASVLTAAAAAVDVVAFAASLQQAQSGSSQMRV